MEPTEGFTGSATTWTAGSLSGVVAAGSSQATLRFKNTSDSPIILHVRKTGSTNDLPVEILPGFYTGDITLTLTSAVTIEYYIEGGGSISCEVIDYGGSLTPSGSATYTTEAKVASLLRLIDTSTGSRLTFSASTDPTLAEVTSYILQAEADIDEATGHSWKATTISNEYHDISGIWSGESSQELPVKLVHRSIRAVTSGTDKIEYWDGSSWIEMVATLTEGRGNDYWVDYTNGFVYFCDTKPQYESRGVRVTYRYGETTVPGDIEEAATKLAAINILENDDYKILIPEGSSDRYSLMSKVESWKKRIEKIIDNRREIQVILSF